MARKQLSKSDIKEWNANIERLYGVADFFDKKEKIEADEQYLVRDGVILFFMKDDIPIPTLKLLLEKNILKKVTVDMGAVKFMAKGADVMRPGIVGLEDGILKDSYVVIVDENNKKPLCVGKMLFSGEDVLSMDNGKVIANVHYVGDELWKS